MTGADPQLTSSKCKLDPLLPDSGWTRNNVRTHPCGQTVTRDGRPRLHAGRAECTRQSMGQRRAKVMQVQKKKENCENKQGFSTMNTVMDAGSTCTDCDVRISKKLFWGGVWPAGRGSSKVIVLKGIGGRVVGATPLTALGEGDVRRTNPKLLHSTRQRREQVKKTEQETRSDTRVRARKRTFSTANS